MAHSQVCRRHIPFVTMPPFALQPAAAPPRAPRPAGRRGWLRRWGRRAALLGAFVGVAAVAYFDWVRIGVQALARSAAYAGAAPAGLGLRDYVATIDARPIAGLHANVSGLTYSPVTGTLFVAINRPAALAEITTDGRLLRRLPLPSAMDPEDISHVAGDLFVIPDESDNQLHWVRIRPGAQTPEVDPAPPLPLNFSALYNLGFEGLAWDAARGELLLANEKWPRRVLAVQGLAPHAHAAAAAVPSADAPAELLTASRPADAALAGATPPHAAPTLRDWWPQGWGGPLGSDLSAITVHPTSGNLLLLSEESSVMTEYSRAGELLGVLPLWRGLHGLQRAAPQPEGMAFGPGDVIYAVSEPNLLYRFERAPRGTAGAR